MANDSIGAQTFVYLRGEMHAPGDKVEEISRPGVDFHAFRLMAAKAMPSKLDGFVDVSTLAAGHALRTTYANLEGTIVSIVQQNVTYPNMLILAARVVGNPIPYANAVGGIAAGTRGVFSEFEVIYAGNT